jgi:hypothetical protein
MELLPVVLRGPFREQRPAAAQRPRCGPRLCAEGLPRAASAVHAVLPHLQAEAAAVVVTLRAFGPLSALPLAGLEELVALLSVVRAQGATRWNLHGHEALIALADLSAFVARASALSSLEPQRFRR